MGDNWIAPLVAEYCQGSVEGKYHNGGDDDDPLEPALVRHVGLDRGEDGDKVEGVHQCPEGAEEAVHCRGGVMRAEVSLELFSALADFGTGEDLHTTSREGGVCWNPKECQVNKNFFQWRLCEFVKEVFKNQT